MMKMFKIDPILEKARQTLRALDAERTWRAEKVERAVKSLDAARQGLEQHRDDLGRFHFAQAVQGATKALTAARAALEDHDAAIVAARLRVTELERKHKPVPSLAAPFFADVEKFASKRVELEHERAALQDEIARLEPLVARASEVAIAAVMGDRDAMNVSADCERAATRLPDARSRLATVNGAIAMTAEYAREAQRQAIVSFVASRREDHRAKVVALLDALLVARDAAAVLRAERNEIEDALGEYDALLRDRSGPNPSPMAAVELQLGSSWVHDLLGGSTPSRFQQFVNEAVEVGVNPTTHAKGRK